MSVKKTYQAQKKDFKIVMKNSEPSEQRLQNSEHIVTQTLPTPHTSTNNTQAATTPTTFPTQTQTRPNPPLHQNLPLPELDTTQDHSRLTRGSEASNGNGKVKKEEIPAGVPELVDPNELTPALEKKAQQLAGVYAQLGMITLGFNPNAGKIIMLSATDRAHELLRVARHHKALMQVVDRLISGNDYFALALGHLGMVLAILAVNNRLPDNPALMGYKMQGMALLAQWEVLQQTMGGESGVSQG